MRAHVSLRRAQVPQALFATDTRLHQPLYREEVEGHRQGKLHKWHKDENGHWNHLHEVCRRCAELPVLPARELFASCNLLDDAIAHPYFLSQQLGPQPVVIHLLLEVLPAARYPSAHGAIFRGLFLVRRCHGRLHTHTRHLDQCLILHPLSRLRQRSAVLAPPQPILLLRSCHRHGPTAGAQVPRRSPSS